MTCWIWYAAAAAAAKSLQSCLTLCDPRDGSPPGSPIAGILQARTLKWVAISFSSAWKWKESEVTQSCPTFSDPMNCSLPGSSIHGIFQARILEWGAIAFSKEENGWCLILLCTSLSPTAVITVKNHTGLLHDPKGSNVKIQGADIRGFHFLSLPVPIIDSVTGEISTGFTVTWTRVGLSFITRPLYFLL